MLVSIRSSRPINEIELFNRLLFWATKVESHIFDQVQLWSGDQFIFKNIIHIRTNGLRSMCEIGSEKKARDKKVMTHVWHQRPPNGIKSLSLSLHHWHTCDRRGSEVSCQNYDDVI